MRTGRPTIIQNILFPVDFSPSCVAMAPFVRKAASIFSARVTLLHVVDLSSSGFELYVRPMREVEEDHEQVARARLNSFLEPDFPVGESTRLVLGGAAGSRASRSKG
jgi:Universal stress protein family